MSGYSADMQRILDAQEEQRDTERQEWIDARVIELTNERMRDTNFVKHALMDCDSLWESAGDDFAIIIAELPDYAITGALQQFISRTIRSVREVISANAEIDAATEYDKTGEDPR